MDNLAVGQRVKLARKEPFFASETVAKALLEQVESEGMRKKQADFESMLKILGIGIGSEGVVRITFAHGYSTVGFDNGVSLDLPSHLLDPITPAKQ